MQEREGRRKGIYLGGEKHERKGRRKGIYRKRIHEREGRKMSI
jgi:hypothetical protein